MRTWFYLVVLTVLAPGSAGASPPLLGAEQCGSCHPSQYAQWRTTAHARAETRLLGAQRRDPHCTSCHSPAARDGHVGVQCEACHGNGRNYWPAEIMKDVALARAVGLRTGGEEYMCRQCHQDEKAGGGHFDYATALKAVVHGPATPKGVRP